MVEVKADALEESFEAFQDDDGVASLKAELETLKAKIAAGAIAAQRVPLDGVKSAQSASFVDQYLRRGIESGLETKAIGSSSDAIGGYAVPQEIDAAIEATLTAISPIRAIANVVKVGSAGYRKLIASGGTPSGFVGFEDFAPESSGSFAGRSCACMDPPQPEWRWLARRRRSTPGRDARAISRDALRHCRLDRTPLRERDRHC